MAAQREIRVEWEEKGKEKAGELEGKGWSRWGRVRDENIKRDILNEGPIMGLARNLTLEKFTNFYKDDPS